MDDEAVHRAVGGGNVERLFDHVRSSSRLCGGGLVRGPAPVPPETATPRRRHQCRIAAQRSSPSACSASLHRGRADDARQVRLQVRIRRQRHGEEVRPVDDREGVGVGDAVVAREELARREHASSSAKRSASLSLTALRVDSAVSLCQSHGLKVLCSSVLTNVSHFDDGEPARRARLADQRAAGREVGDVLQQRRGFGVARAVVELEQRHVAARRDVEVAGAVGSVCFARSTATASKRRPVSRRAMWTASEQARGRSRASCVFSLAVRVGKTRGDSRIANPPWNAQEADDDCEAQYRLDPPTSS
jgi:hypothetical protein